MDNTLTGTVPVIILNWNGWSDTVNCLESLHQATDVSEIWLVDNGSDEDRSDSLRQRFQHLRVIRLDHNYGWAGGYNRALRVAIDEGYDAAYLLNNDTRVGPDFLVNTVSVLNADDRVAAVGSLVAYAEPEGYVQFDGEYHSRGEQPVVASDEVRQVKYVMGAGMLVRLAAIEEVGYFDERYFCYREETEWCRRALSQNWHLALSCASLVVNRSQGSDVNHNAAYFLHRNAFLDLDLEVSSLHHAVIRKIRIAYFLTRAANVARLEGNQMLANALAAAVYDGVLGRYGRRHSLPDLAQLLLTRCIPLRPGIRRYFMSI